MKLEYKKELEISKEFEPFILSIDIFRVIKRFGDKFQKKIDELAPEYTLWYINKSDFGTFFEKVILIDDGQIRMVDFDKRILCAKDFQDIPDNITFYTSEQELIDDFYKHDKVYVVIDTTYNNIDLSINSKVYKDKSEAQEYFDNLVMEYAKKYTITNKNINDVLFNDKESGISVEVKLNENEVI